MLKGFKQITGKYGYLILPIITLLCLAGFIGSYLFPNEVLDTYEVNMDEDEGDTETVRYLTGVEDEIGYIMQTDGRALKGIQIGISKNGAALTGTELVYRVYRLSDEVSMNELPAEMTSDGLELLLEKSYDLGACLDGQYPYLSFDEEDLCSGKLYLTFTFRANGSAEAAVPGIFLNHAKVDQAATYVEGAQVVDKVNGEDAAQMLKGYYIYSHDTYPLLYDARVLTFVFLAASATVCYPKRRKTTTKQSERSAVGEDETERNETACEMTSAVKEKATEQDETTMREKGDAEHEA